MSDFNVFVGMIMKKGILLLLNCLLLSFVCLIYYVYTDIKNEFKQEKENTNNLVKLLSNKSYIQLNELVQYKNTDYICLSEPYAPIVDKNICSQLKDRNSEDTFSLTIVDITNCSINRNIYRKYYENEHINLLFHKKYNVNNGLNVKCAKIIENSKVWLEINKNSSFFNKTIYIGV